MSQEPDWLRLQKLIFKRYVSQALIRGGRKRDIEDIVKDTADGSILLDLVECLTGKDSGVKRPKNSNKFEVQAFVSTTLDYIKKDILPKQKLTISTENIMDGDEKQILGLIFQVILSQMKFDTEDESETNDAKQALMLWLKNRTKGYSNVEIKDFTKSFHDGLAFLSLIHKLRPRLVDYEAKNAGNGPENLKEAIATAERWCNVEAYLEAEDIPKLDEVSMIIYLSDWYLGISLLMKQDVAAKRIGKLVELTELHDKMRADYNASAADLVAWVAAKKESLDNRDFGSAPEGEGRLAEVEQLLADFYAYKEGEKVERLAQRLDAETVFDNLAVRLAKIERPPFVPETTPEALDALFEEVNAKELERSKALREEIARQNKIIDDRICGEFAAVADQFLQWLNAKRALLKANKEKDLETQLAELEASTSDHGKWDEFLGQMGAIEEKMQARNITDSHLIPYSKGDCASLWAQHLQVLTKKKELLVSQIEEQKKGGLTEEQAENIKANFAFFDGDGSGFLERRELRACMISLGEDATPADIDAVMKEYDTTGDGKINFAEFEQYMMTRLGDTNSEEEIVLSFKYLSYEKEHVLEVELANVINDRDWKERHVEYLKTNMAAKEDGLDFTTWTSEVFQR